MFDILLINYRDTCEEYPEEFVEEMKNYKSLRFEPEGFAVNNEVPCEQYLRYRNYIRSMSSRKEKGVKIQVSPNK